MEQVGEFEEYPVDSDGNEILWASSRIKSATGKGAGVEVPNEKNYCAAYFKKRPKSKDTPADVLDRLKTI